jgi:hypothetical protein
MEAGEPDVAKRYPFLLAIYVKRSALMTLDVPPGVVTDTSTLPFPLGDLALIWSAETTLKLADRAPKSTRSTCWKLEPRITTLVPPTAGPSAGERPETLLLPRYVKRSRSVVPDVPPAAVVTDTATVPVPLGDMVRISSSEITVKCADLAPK